MTLKSAPFVEIVAELRWSPEASTSHQITTPSNAGLQQITFHDSNSFESFFMKFGGLAHNLGFSQTERLLPMGFPTVAYQPVFRFRADGNPSKIYQVGAGLFTANAVAPYKSWDDFAPDIEKGVAALLTAREGLEADAAFNSVSLRYLDAFTSELTGDRGAAQFIDEVFGLKVELPPAISNLIVDGGIVTPNLQFQLPLKEGLLMHIAVGDGMAHGKKAVVMETTVATTIPTAANVQALMEALSGAHEIIHTMFFELVAPIRPLLDNATGD